MNGPLHQQHDVNPALAEKLIADLRLNETTAVYEVGPGLGALTKPILAAGPPVVAVEIDAARASGLRQSCADYFDSGQLRLLCSDARRFIPDVAGPWRIIANPPFQHSAELLTTWLVESAAIGFPQAMDLVIQQQTALKWVGESGRWTRSSVLLRLVGTPYLRQRLRRNDVTPPARVDLAWWTWRIHPSDDRPDHFQLQRVARLLEVAFRGDHSVRQALRGIATGPILKRQGKEYGWDPDGPSRAVPPRAWLALANFLASIGKLK